MTERSKRGADHVKTVTTPLDDIQQDAALAVSLDPDETTIVSAKVTAENKLQLTLEGPKR